MIETPVSESLFNIAVDTGDGPLYFGSSEGCKFKQPNLNVSKISFGSKIPYAPTTAKSASQLFNSLMSISACSASGRTATVAAEVCTRPCVSVLGTL